MTPAAEVAPGILVATSRLWSTTSTAIAGADGGCLLVDPGLTVGDLTDLADAVAARGWHVVAGFSTHPHWDHVLWSAPFGGATRWATREACDVAERNATSLAAEADAEAPGHDHALTARLTPVPDDGVVPWPGPRAVALPYRAHSPGSAALVVPERGLLCAGDVLSDREVPLLDLDAPDPVGDSRRALDLLEAAIAEHDVRVVVPGHGTVTDAAGARARADRDRRYLDDLASGRPVADERLADQWVAAQHERQLIWAAGGRTDLD